MYLVTIDARWRRWRKEHLDALEASS